MKRLLLFCILLSCFSCEKEAFPASTNELSEVRTTQRGKNIARVNDYFVRLLGTGTTSTALTSSIFSNNQNPYILNCTSTTFPPNNTSQLQINFDTTGNCTLPNGASIHGELKWDLNFNQKITDTRECQPAFLRMDRLYIDGAVVEEIRLNGVASPKFFYNSGCNDPSTLSDPTDAEVSFDFKASGQNFDYQITTPDGCVTVIDPVASPGHFARMTSANDFDETLNIQDLYERQYKVDILVSDGITFCPFTEVFVHHDGNTATPPDDSYIIRTTESLVYYPLQCQFLTSGFVELREIPDYCTGELTAEDTPLLTTIDFSVDAAGTPGAGTCDSYIKICDFSENPSAPDCEIVSYE